MSDDYLNMAKISAVDSEARLDDRIERERRVQTRSAQIRRVCLYVAILGAAVAFTCHVLATLANLSQLGMLVDVFMIPTLAACVILVLTGGLSPQEVTRCISRRQQDLLDG